MQFAPLLLPTSLSEAVGSYATFSWPGANAAGVVAFPAKLAGAGADFGLFVGGWDPDGLTGGLYVSEVGGIRPADTFDSFVSTSINTAGQVAFGATTSGGSNGVLLATPEAAEVPALSTPALLGLLAAAACSALAHRA